MYLEERDWYKAQLEAYEAQFEELEEFRLEIPWRPTWRSLSDRERSELLEGEKRENGADRFVEYRAVRHAYLAAKPFDHGVLAAWVAQDAEELKQREAVKTLRQGFGQNGAEQGQESAASSSPVVPQPPGWRVDIGNEMEGVEQQVDAKVEEHPHTGGPKTGASPVPWATVVPQLPGQLTGNEVKMSDEEVRAEAESDEQQEADDSAMEAASLSWSAVVPQPPGKLGKPSSTERSRDRDRVDQQEGVNTHEVTQDNWEAVGAEAVGHAWNDPEIFASLDEDD